MFTVGSSTSATFVLPVRHGTGVALKKRVWTQYGRFPKSSMEQSCKWDTMATMKKVRVLHRKAWNQRIQIFYVEYDDQAEVREASSSRLDNSHWISFSLPFRRNKVYASWKLDKASILVNRGSHFQVHFVWQVWDGQLAPAFKTISWKAFGGWKFDRGTTKLHARILRGKGVQKKKPNMFTIGSSTSATFDLPVYIYIHICLVYIYIKIYYIVITNACDTSAMLLIPCKMNWCQHDLVQVAFPLSK